MYLVAEELNELIGNGLWLDMRSRNACEFGEGQLRLRVQLRPGCTTGENELKVMIFHDQQKDPDVDWQLSDLLIPPMFRLVAWGYSQHRMKPLEWSRDHDQGYYFVVFRQACLNGVPGVPDLFSYGGEYILYQLESHSEFLTPIRHLRLVG